MEDGLYSVKGTNKSQRISYDVDLSDYGLYYMRIFKGKTLYYTSDEELDVSSGDKGVAIGNFDGDVTSLIANNFCVIATITDGNETSVYLSSDGSKFDLIGTNTEG